MDWQRRRTRMVERYVRARGVSDEVVLGVLENLPRHRFVEEALQDRAYGEDALPIGSGQTISRPYIVGRMTELLEVEPGHRVLEVGTGSGYQAAVLSRLAQVVYTVERIRDLSERARRILQALGIQNVFFRVSDGGAGWPEAGPFQRILVTAGARSLPTELLDQLDKDSGRLVAPVRQEGEQTLVLVRREGDRWVEEPVEPCEFVPLIRGS